MSRDHEGRDQGSGDQASSDQGSRDQGVKSVRSSEQEKRIKDQGIGDLRTILLTKITAT